MAFLPGMATVMRMRAEAAARVSANEPLLNRGSSSCMYPASTACKGSLQVVTVLDDRHGDGDVHEG